MIKLDYTFSRELVKKTTISNSVTETRIYLGGVEYVNNVMESYQHPEGRLIEDNSVVKFQYKIASCRLCMG